MSVYLNAQYQKFGGRSAGFWSAHPAEGLPGNEKFYGDFLRAQYRLEVQRARLHSSGYADSACQMMLQLLPGPSKTVRPRANGKSRCTGSTSTATPPTMC
ncbi:hypothetical protein QNM99_28080 [Pseudomonas sp. PCH446]